MLTVSLGLKLEKDLAEQAAKQAEEEERAAKAKKREEAVANGNSMECGCCFDDDVLVRTILFELDMSDPCPRMTWWHAPTATCSAASV